MALTRISIHAAREGGDQPTFAAEDFGCNISIHAAREGGDALIMHSPPSRQNFNPRRP